VNRTCKATWETCAPKFCIESPAENSAGRLLAVLVVLVEGVVVVVARLGAAALHGAREGRGGGGAQTRRGGGAALGRRRGRHAARRLLGRHGHLGGRLVHQVVLGARQRGLARVRVVHAGRRRRQEGRAQWVLLLNPQVVLWPCRSVSIWHLEGSGSRRGCHGLLVLVEEQRVERARAGAGRETTRRKVGRRHRVEWWRARRHYSRTNHLPHGVLQKISFHDSIFVFCKC